MAVLWVIGSASGLLSCFANTFVLDPGPGELLSPWQSPNDDENFPLAPDTYELRSSATRAEEEDLEPH